MKCTLKDSKKVMNETLRHLEQKRIAVEQNI